MGVELTGSDRRREREAAWGNQDSVCGNEASNGGHVYVLCRCEVLGGREVCRGFKVQDVAIPVVCSG